MPKLVARLLGGLEYFDSDGAEVVAIARKTRALLAFLIIERHRGHGRERLAGLLWGERGEAQARNSLNQALHEIRKIERALEIDLTERQPDGVRAVPANVDADLYTFETKLAFDPVAAVGLYTGDLLEGFELPEMAFSDWLTEKRSAYRNRLINAFDTLPTAAGNPALAAAAAQKLLAIDPLNEPIRRHLMRLHAKAGNRSEALRQHQIGEDLLRSELGIAPERETLDLVAEIKRGHAMSAPRPTPAGANRSANSSERAAATLAEKPSLAVLPFGNLTSDPDQEYFADGIAEDVTAALSRFRSLFVITRNSAFVYKRRAVAVQQIAHELGVRYVVEGSVRKAGRRVRITAQLIDASSGNHIWADKFEGNLDDLFDLQDRITDQIVIAVAPEVEVHERERARRTPPDNLDAWSLFQRGLTAYYATTPASWEEAITLFERAIEADTDFAPAYAMAADTRCSQILFGTPDRRQDLLETAERLSKKALSLDSKDPVCFFARGRIHCFQGKHEIAIENIERAIALNPNFALAHYGLGYVFVVSGRSEEALKKYEELQRLSPHDALAPAYMMLRSTGLFDLGRWEESVEWERRAIESVNPRFMSYALLAGSLNELGREKEAHDVLNQLLLRKPEFSLRYVKHMGAHYDPTMLRNRLRVFQRLGIPE